MSNTGETNHEFDWRTAADEDVERQYSPSRFSLRPIEDYLREYADLSARAGDPPSLRIPGAPLLVYIHGGYWQQLSASDSLFNAADAQRHGVSLAAVEYALAPRATIEQIVGECISEVLDIVADCDPSFVVLAGCSAGAHLVASCLHHASVADIVDAAVLLSGIYDLRPLVRTTTNDVLSLDVERAARLSPLFFQYDQFPKSLVAVGRHEPSEFIRQSHDFAMRVTGSSAVVVEQRDHFGLPYDLLSEGTVVGDWVLEQMKGHRS